MKNTIKIQQTEVIIDQIVSIVVKPSKLDSSWEWQDGEEETFWNKIFGRRKEGFYNERYCGGSVVTRLAENLSKEFLENHGFIVRGKEVFNKSSIQINLSNGQYHYLDYDYFHIEEFERVVGELKKLTNVVLEIN